MGNCSCPIFSNSTEHYKPISTDKKKETYEDFKYNIPKLSDDELKEFNTEVIDIYKHKCKFEINDNGNSVSFYPSPHVKQDEYGNDLFDTELLCDSQLIKSNVNKLEGINNWDEKVILEDGICSFIQVCCKAWTKHYPLRISPSNILLLILQAVAIHVDKNSEKLRNKYVTHSNKMKLKVNRIDVGWVMGSRNNDWSGVIKEFCEQIDKNTVNDTGKLMESDFSCSTIVDKICNKITIMDICKNYFEYFGYCGFLCGFPKITLDGTKSDWIKLKKKCARILRNKVDKCFGEKWSLSLLPVLDRFIAVYDGNIDCVFWNCMIKKTDVQYHGSGGPTPEQYWGWINVFFPYMQAYKGVFEENRICFEPYEMSKYNSLTRFGNGGCECSKFPTGLSSAPVTWKDINTGKIYKLKFYSGFMGYKQDEKSLELSPVASWFIGYSDDDDKN
eukprot:341740_1